MAKRLLIFLMGSVGLAGGIFLAFQEKRPDSAEAALLHPVERVAYSTDWRTSTRREGRPGETSFVILRLPEKEFCTRVSADQEVTFSQLLPVTTRAPSSEGGRAGTFHEIVAPRTVETCGLSRYVLAEFKMAPEPLVFDIAGQRLEVVRHLHTRPRTGRPFFMGLGNANLIRGHCPDAWCNKETPLGHAYAQLLVEHGIQPIQNWVAVPPVRHGRLDLDAGQAAGRSFRQLVMGYALSGWVGFPRATRYPDPVGYVKALERTIVAEGLRGRAWVYAIDEPADPQALGEVLALYRTHAPSLKVMVTTDFHAGLVDGVDIFAPVYNHLVSPRKPDVEAYGEHMLWTYLSCAGSCGPNRAARPDVPFEPGPDSGLADLLIDRPAGRLFDFFKDVAAKGLDGVLYYEASEGLGLTRVGIDPLVDVWNFGGNGDGLLVFPGRPGDFGLSTHKPLPSFRLKLIRHALQAWG